MKKILLLVLLLCATLGLSDISFAGYVDLNQEAKEIRNTSIAADKSFNNDPVDNIIEVGFSLLGLVKMVLQGVIIIFIVYIGAQMIISMWNDEELLSKAKRQIWYSLLGILFINIPGGFYSAFRKKDNFWTVGWPIDNGNFTQLNEGSNILFNIGEFGYTLNDSIIGFLEIIIFGLAVGTLVITGIRVMTARWEEEKLSKAKTRILWSLVALVFVGFIESWKHLAFGGSIEAGVNLFESFANLALFFAGPIGIFFLTLAGYYYITSAGDEERTKKAKSIVINTVLATLILLATYTFLLDLASIGN